MLLIIWLFLPHLKPGRIETVQGTRRFRKGKLPKITPGNKTEGWMVRDNAFHRTDKTGKTTTQI